MYNVRCLWWRVVACGGVRVCLFSTCYVFGRSYIRVITKLRENTEIDSKMPSFRSSGWQQIASTLPYWSHNVNQSNMMHAMQSFLARTIQSSLSSSNPNNLLTKFLNLFNIKLSSAHILNLKIILYTCNLEQGYLNEHVFLFNISFHFLYTCI